MIAITSNGQLIEVNPGSNLVGTAFQFVLVSRKDMQFARFRDWFTMSVASRMVHQTMDGEEIANMLHRHFAPDLWEEAESGLCTLEECPHPDQCVPNCTGSTQQTDNQPQGCGTWIV